MEMKRPLQRRKDHWVLKKPETGVPVKELCREHGLSGGSFCIEAQQVKYSGMDVCI